MPAGRISVRVNDTRLQRLESEAASRGTTPSEVLRLALDEFFTAHSARPNCYDLARKAGLIGAVEDAPADLSSSRRHFKGFGES